MNDYKFGNILTELRKAKHLSQKELGHLLSVSDKAVSRWENGNAKPRASILPKLAKILGVSVDRLLGGNDTTTVTAVTPASGDFIVKKRLGSSVPDTAKVNFIPKESTPNGNYLCTWHMQESAADKLSLTAINGTVRMRDALTEQNLFDTEEFFHPYSHEYRKGLIFLIDDGWDVPFGVDASEPIFGLVEPDREKFASMGNTPEERLIEMSRKVKEMGYVGLGLWISPNNLNATQPFSMDVARKYWEDRAKWCNAADVRYWKCDWGTFSRYPGYREMMTECVRKYAPNLLIEHARGFLPFHDMSNNQCVVDMCKAFEYSDVLRTYDVQPPFADVETYLRVHKLLTGIDKSKVRHNAKGLVNVESQPMVAAGLSMNIGIMSLSYETEALLRWQRICPPFAATETDYTTSEEMVVDRLRFDVQPSDWRNIQWSEFSVEVPMVAARGTKLPIVTSNGEKPIILASKHPTEQALCVSALRRNIDPNRNIAVPCDVTIYPESLKTTVGVFGIYNSLTLEFPSQVPKSATVWSQCMLDDVSVNITDHAEIKDNQITIDGLLLRRLGHKSGEKLQEHEPALIIKIC
ncbi:MAG: helix-turn-helix transcriptional regulator [Clostridia bacterium]|nr:helix-turn-helix transcriptional regulator [Clostridia bacterium]